MLYIYIYIDIHTYVYVYVYIYRYKYICIYIYVTYMYIYICTHIHIYIYIYIYIYIVKFLHVSLQLLQQLNDAATLERIRCLECLHVTYRHMNLNGIGLQQLADGTPCPRELCCALSWRAARSAVRSSRGNE